MDKKRKQIHSVFDAKTGNFAKNITFRVRKVSFRLELLPEQIKPKAPSAAAAGVEAGQKGGRIAARSTPQPEVSTAGTTEPFSFSFCSFHP